MTERTTSVLTGLALALIPALALLTLIQYGLPHWLAPDEAYILKDPFKLLVSYAHGDFTSPTNLYFWLIPFWYGLVFAGGIVGGAWHSASEFSALIIGEAPVFLYWGRMLGALAYVGSVYVLYQVLVMTVPKDRPLRLMAGIVIAANPIALVTVGFGKFDGMACLVTAGLIWTMAQYLTKDSLAWRRRLYVLACVAVAFRPDFAAVLVAIVGHDLIVRKPVRPVIGAAAAGLGAYAVISLAPVALVYNWVVGSRGATVAVGPSFESAIAGHYLGGYHGITDVVSAVGANAAYYGLLLVMLGPAVLAAFWPGVTRDRMTRLFPGVAGITMIPIVLFPVHSPHYVLQAFAYLWLAAVWRLAAVRRPSVRYGVLATSVVATVSLSVSTFRTIQANSPDPRIVAGEYLVAHTVPSDTLALEEYENPGSSAIVSECPEILTAKAEAIVASGLGSGQTFAAWAKIPKPACRQIVSVSMKDPFERTAFVGRWTLDYTKTPQLPYPLPAYLSTHFPLGRATQRPQRQRFDQWAQGHYVLEQVFATTITDPRVAVLLEITYFPASIYVYRRRPDVSEAAPVAPVVGP